MLKRAVHPGEILKDELEERGVSLASFARQIDVPTNRVSQIMAGKRAVTGDSAFRYPGRILAAGEAIPLSVLRFIAAQLGMGVEDLDGYAIREETRWEHLAELRRTTATRCSRDVPPGT